MEPGVRSEDKNNTLAIVTGVLCIALLCGVSSGEVGMRTFEGVAP